MLPAASFITASAHQGGRDDEPRPSRRSSAARCAVGKEAMVTPWRGEALKCSTARHTDTTALAQRLPGEVPWKSPSMPYAVKRNMTHTHKAPAPWDGPHLTSHGWLHGYVQFVKIYQVLHAF